MSKLLRVVFANQTPYKVFLNFHCICGIHYSCKTVRLLNTIFFYRILSRELFGESTDASMSKRSQASVFKGRRNIRKVLYRFVFIYLYTDERNLQRHLVSLKLLNKNNLHRKIYFVYSNVKSQFRLFIKYYTLYIIKLALVSILIKEQWVILYGACAQLVIFQTR